jgi:hypothetical protein
VHYLKVGVWCAVKVHKITGPIYFKETLNTYQYVWLILTPLFEDLTVEEEMYGHLMYGNLMLDSAISYTLNYSVAALEGMLVMQPIMYCLWPPKFRLEYVILCVRDTEIWSFCEQAASLLLKDTI